MILEDVKINVKMKISGLWVAVMLCYLYGDIVRLYEPGALEEMLAGRMGPLGPTTQGLLLGVAMFMAIPALMVFLSLVLNPKANRWANIILGLVFTVVMLITMPGASGYYIFLGIVEVALTALIVWHAWKWPRQEA